MKSKINKTHALDPYQYDKGYFSLNGKKTFCVDYQKLGELEWRRIKLLNTAETIQIKLLKIFNKHYTNRKGATFTYFLNCFSNVSTQ